VSVRDSERAKDSEGARARARERQNVCERERQRKIKRSRVRERDGKRERRQRARGTEIERMSPKTHIADLSSLKIVSASTVIKNSQNSSRHWIYYV